MKRFLLIVWQLPQYLVGWLILSVVLMMRMMTDYQVFYSIDDLDLDVFYLRIKNKRVRWGFTLADMVFLAVPLGSGYTDDIMRILNHECGHARQSRRLGWLYLFVIALPSLLVTWISPTMASRCWFEQWEM